MQGANHLGFTPWTKDGSKVEPLVLDKDVFGDGSVVVLRTPGHTPGHSALLVNLRQKGAVILVGDLTHFQENWDTNGVPTFNFDRAQTLASIERVKKIAEKMKATVVIQHDTRHIDKLPAWPSPAR
jgi:glyoxylase-like metal-dependent hydrolase (beta-lactamase superfamily II)